jgi:uncharacterized membrane protein YkvA (DUF1232 family)
MRILEYLKSKAEVLKRETYVVYLASKDSRTPWYAKALILFTLGYALSPIDLIPDFIPVLGYLDDIILLPALIAICIKLIPHEVIHQCRLQVQHQSLKGKKSYVAAIIIILIWLVCLFWMATYFYPFFFRK